VFFAPQALLQIFPKTVETPRRASEVFATFFRDIWTMCKQRRCRYGLLVFLAPVCSFALPFATVAPEFHVTERWATLLNGPLNSVICSAGCLVSVWVCRRIPARMAYVLPGQAAALVTLAMMGLAHDFSVYVTALVLYVFLQGINYAAFSVVLYGIVGKDNPLSGTMSAFLAAVSNFPISMMGALDATGLKYRGIQGMLGTDTFVALAFGIPLLFFFARVHRLGLEHRPELAGVDISA
jgi:PAT family beta-lactamase induction signal transducer AmpG